MLGDQEVAEAEAEALEEVVVEEAAAAGAMVAVMVKADKGNGNGTETIRTLPISRFATILPRSMDSSTKPRNPNSKSGAWARSVRKLSR